MRFAPLHVHNYISQYWWAPCDNFTVVIGQIIEVIFVVFSVHLCLHQIISVPMYIDMVRRMCLINSRASAWLFKSYLPFRKTWPCGAKSLNWCINHSIVFLSNPIKDVYCCILLYVILYFCMNSRFSMRGFHGYIYATFENNTTLNLTVIDINSTN